MWKFTISCSLSIDGATRYNDIKRKMGSISNTMLAKSLKELEDDGLVKRTEYLEVPIRVEYEIADSVRSLIPILAELAAWGQLKQRFVFLYRFPFRAGSLRLMIFGTAPSLKRLSEKRVCCQVRQHALFWRLYCVIPAHGSG
ncbi:MAG: helix-turn-helix transcriptional regulator [Oscillospiraceae bacterium]|nr:helix-turn-helix transcriptional regulator [Oscillospiraceae bacterium]